MKVLIIEDEDLAVAKLKRSLRSIEKDIDIVGITDSIESSVAWLSSNPAPDIILADIELVDGQSFEIFNRVQVTSTVIFTTSYDEYALKAFKVNSVDYLLKPVQKEELENALNKFSSWIDKPKTAEAAEPVVVNVENLALQLHQRLNTQNYRKRFLVKSIQKLVSVNVEDIAYFYSDEKLNFFRTYSNKRYVVDYTMDELETMLKPEDFYRISRSFFVAPESLEQISDYFGHRLVLKLRPDHEKEVIVSREKVTEFKNWLGK
ncbi:LytR/AlgR family response regulator transcription factor [Dyadobacter crusticola]|uniref:LytR/AlgR family response regulator transcription factor n=1 Tax=Dyadobacter crusticola TaxID=292407 RepID=UPI0004E24CDF|nr:LytTR family DNA-binding domain-containing protein [Dyadobacter crusticola]